MEQSRLSLRSISVAAILHLLFLYLLFYLTQSGGPLSLFTPPKQAETEPAVVWMPTQPPQATAPAAAVQQPLVHPQVTQPTEQEEPHEQEQQKDREEDAKPVKEKMHTTSSMSQPKDPWSAERAKRAWKKVQPPRANNNVSNASTHYQDGMMHKIIEGIPLEEKGVPLRQRVNAQFIRDGRENYQFGIIKGICYELNKQKIMEAAVNLPRKIVFNIKLERNGNLIDARLIEASHSESFNNACLQAIRAASPYRVAPASVEGDPVTIMFTLYHDHSGIQNSNVPTPITFFMN